MCTSGVVQVLQQLRADLSSRQGEVSGLTRQVEELEGSLHKLQQELYIEQMTTAELQAEVRPTLGNMVILCHDLILASFITKKNGNSYFFFKNSFQYINCT